MVFGTATAAIVMLSFDGGGFHGTRGFPFAWYWWNDTGEIGTPLRGVSWFGLVADLIFWLAVIVALGLFVEWVTRRFIRRYETANAA